MKRCIACRTPRPLSQVDQFQDGKWRCLDVGSCARRYRYVAIVQARRDGRVPVQEDSK